MGLTSARVRALNAVVEEGGFTAAARRLGVSQPAITQHVRDLQLEFGVRLFERRANRLVPTDLCEALYRITAEIKQREDAALRLLQEGRRAMVDAEETLAAGQGGGDDLDGVVVPAAG